MTMQTKRDAVTFRQLQSADTLCRPEKPKYLLMPQISCNTRILNVTDGSHPRYSQAKKAVDVCSCAWVDEDDHLRGIRRLTVSESIAQRNHMARAEATRHLQGAEIAGLRYQRPESSTWQQAHLDAQNKFNGCLKAAREFSDCQCSWCSALAHRLAIREAALSCN